MQDSVELGGEEPIKGLLKRKQQVRPSHSKNGGTSARRTGVVPTKPQRVVSSGANAGASVGSSKGSERFFEITGMDSGSKLHGEINPTNIHFL